MLFFARYSSSYELPLLHFYHFHPHFYLSSRLNTSKNRKRWELSILSLVRLSGKENGKCYGRIFVLCSRLHSDFIVSIVQRLKKRIYVKTLQVEFNTKPPDFLIFPNSKHFNCFSCSTFPNPYDFNFDYDDGNSVALQDLRYGQWNLEIGWVLLYSNAICEIFEISIQFFNCKFYGLKNFWLKFLQLNNLQSWNVKFLIPIC